MPVIEDFQVGRVNPLGLYDINRRIRPVGEAYRELIKEFGTEPVVPNGVFLDVK